MRVLKNWKVLVTINEKPCLRQIVVEKSSQVLSVFKGLTVKNIIIVEKTLVFHSRASLFEGTSEYFFNRYALHTPQ